MSLPHRPVSVSVPTRSGLLNDSPYLPSLTVVDFEPAETKVHVDSMFTGRPAVENPGWLKPSSMK